MIGAQIPGDLALAADHTRFALHSGPELTRNRVHVLLTTPKGTYWVDVNVGFPYREIYALRGREIALAQEIFTQWLSSLSFVVSVNVVSAQYDRARREYYFTFAVKSRYTDRVEGTATIALS